MVEKYHKLVVLLTRRLDFLGGISIALMMLIITVNVILRKLSITFGGASEYVQFLMAACVGFSIANCAVQKGHIEISIFVDHMPKVPRVFFEILINLITMIFVAAASYFLVLYGIDYIRTGTVGMISRMPYYPFAWVSSLGFLVYCFVAIDNILHIITGRGQAV